MVTRIRKKGKTFFQCDECRFIYAEEAFAEKCKAWCKEHHSCSIEITKHAIEIQGKNRYAKE